MKKVGFVCRKCGEKFTAEIFERGEAEEKKVPTSPVRCPQCGSISVEKRQGA